MDDHNMDKALLVNTRKVLTRLFKTPYTNIAWAIKSGLEYPKDLNVAGTFQHLFIYTTFLTNIKNGL